MLQPAPKRILLASFWWLEDQMLSIAREAERRHWYLDPQMCVDNKIPESWQGDGIITTLSGDLADLGRLFNRAGCPVVSLNQHHPELNVPCVGLDQTVAGRMAARHFLERGFRSLAHFTRGGWDVTRRMYVPFEEALLKSKATVSNLVWQPEKEGKQDSWLNRHHWLRHQLRSLSKPLGVLAAEALAPAEIIEAAHEEGLAVPDDVAVMGLFDTELFRSFVSLPITTIIQDFDEQVRAACDLLSRLMDGAPPPVKPILLPPSDIATRESTDTIAARHPLVVKAVRYMQKNYSAPLSIAGIARVAGVSRTSLYNLFEADLGQSPHATLIQIRLMKATFMLRETDEKIAAISEACGFGDSFNIYHHFKTRLGTTPAMYRDSRTRK